MAHEVSRYGTRDVPVRGGSMRVGFWDSDDVAAGRVPAAVVLAVHGVTASHMSWPLVARLLTAGPGVRVVAPDLRGRGRSADLPGPWGMPAHAADLCAVLDAFAIEHAVVVGHSMGGFASVVFAHLYPSRTSSLVLVDGGIPLPAIPGATDEQALRATLGPAAQRLEMTFESRAAYRDFWRQHPALVADWSAAVTDYVDYDLVGEAPRLRSSARYEAVAADSAELRSDGSITAAWRDLAHDAVFLRAPLGLLAEPPGLYPPEDVAAWALRHPSLRWMDVTGVNHYTITLGAAGARAVAAAANTAFGQAGQVG